MLKCPYAQFIWHQCTKTWKVGDIVSHILNFGTRCGEWLSSESRRFIPGIDPDTHWLGIRWAAKPVYEVIKKYSIYLYSPRRSKTTLVYVIR
jgi:hypothetical protein